jgi:uncharacterized protein (DUF1800 family)
MKKVRPHRLFVSPAAFLAGLILSGAFLTPAGLLFGDEKPQDEPSPIAPLLLGLTPEASGVAFLTQKTRVWLGRNQIICFYAKDAPAEDRFFSFKADENFLHVLIPPTLAPGSHIGYIRLRPLKEGHTQIRLEGATLDVDIVKDVAAGTLELTRPQIVTPVEGAVVWGKFVVGVEQLNLSTYPLPPPPMLRLPDGHEIEAQKVPDQQPGPNLRYAFTVDAKSLRPGANELVAVFKNEPGHEIVSDPIDIVALEPNPAAIQSGDCKDRVNTQWPPPKIPFAYPLGESKALTPPTVIADAKSVFGPIVSNPGENPAWYLPVTVPTKGLYEMVVTARGDIGGNALPTLALMVDDSGNAATSARLATTEWQRMPVGHPITLEAGNHVLSVRFRNGFSSNPSDSRHLYLARYELAALDQLPAPALAANNAATMTMQDATAMQSKPAVEPMMQAAAMQDGAAMQSKPATGPMMQSIPPIGSFHIVFKDALEGQVIANQVQINALCWWPNRDHSPPPTVDLLVNDKVVASLTTPRPHFRIDVSAFRPEKNKIELRGLLPNGQAAHSTVENIFLPHGLYSSTEPYRPAYKFYVYDPAWEGSLNQHINTGDPDPVAEFFTNGDATLKLPEALQGPCKLSIEARGTDFNGPAVATLLLKANGQETKLGEVPVGASLAVLPVAQTTFAAGPKTLIVRYANDAYEKDKGDRNLYVHSVQMDPVQAEPNKTLPVAVIVYPRPGAEVGLADAVVGNVSGNQGLVQADLLIDGQPQHLNLKAPNGLGPILFPLLTRNLTPGSHQLQITVKDDAGNSGQSGKVTVVVTGKAEAAKSPYSRALLLLNRFGYGPEPRELAAILTMGPHLWLQTRLNETMESPLEENEQERLHAEYPDLNAVVPRALQYLVTDANPVRARFLMWAENHFSTWISKDGTPEKALEHDRFLELGIVPFPDLLLASATSPAMLIYLDQRNSVTKRLNENYAREIMELHTLGVKAGYTQQDVTTLADLLTGWTVADEAPMDGSQNLARTFRYDPYLNSGSACLIFGMEFPGVPLNRRFDRVLTALNMLSAHPSCALFISRKLVEHYVSDPAPPELVNDMARIYLETGGDLRVMLLALSEKPAFWAVPAKVTSPIDFGVRLTRMAGSANPGPINELASHSGMGMFDRATPDGYPDADGYFVSSNALLQRWHFAQNIQNSFLANGLIPNDWKPADHQWDPATTQRLVDLAAVRITGDVLGPNSNKAALQLIASSPENTNGRLHLLATFLCQVPETSLR